MPEQTFTFTVHLGWLDYVTAGVSVMLLVSFWLAARSRETAIRGLVERFGEAVVGNDRSSMIQFLWSSALLFTGHAALFVCAAFISLEGLWITNVGFMFLGGRMMVRLIVGLRRLKRQQATIEASSVEPAPGAADALVDAAPPPPELAPARPATNGHRLPTQRPAPSGSGPWPHPANQAPEAASKTASKAAAPGDAALLTEQTRTEVLTPGGGS